MENKPAPMPEIVDARLIEQPFEVVVRNAATRARENSREDTSAAGDGNGTRALSAREAKKLALQTARENARREKHEAREAKRAERVQPPATPTIATPTLASSSDNRSSADRSSFDELLAPRSLNGSEEDDLA